MEEFIFGSLSTAEKRLHHVMNKRQGVQHNSWVQPSAPEAGDTPVLTVRIGLPKPITKVECLMTQPETAVFSFTLVETKWDLFNWQYMQIWQLALPAQPNSTLVRYTIKATPADGTKPIFSDNGKIFSYFVCPNVPPDWTHDAILYQIFPDRFYPGNGRSWNSVSGLNDVHGGTIRGIIDKLNYLEELGINCLWLNPFLPDPNTHHGYHAVDHFSINPRLGTLDEMRELVDKAHGRGMHLIFDFVGNHWGSGHPTFQEAKSDPNSPYRDWYKWIEWPDEYWSFFAVQDLPEVNTQNPEVRDYLFRSALFWLNDVGFDGLRLDYVLGPTRDFWTELRAVVKQAKPNAWIFGEAVESPETVLGYNGRFDGCLDFILAQTLRDTFTVGGMDAPALDAFLHQHEAFFGCDLQRPSFLDNHDMDRFLLRAKGDIQRLKLAALCLFTLRGQPIIYYGTEVGLGQNFSFHLPESEGMAECRQPMLWDDAQNGELLDYFKWLIRLRRDNPIIGQQTRQTFHVNGRSNTLVYGYSDSSDEKNGRLLAVALNLSSEPQQINVPLPHLDQPHTFTLEPLQGDVFVLPT